jgi:AbrB family looped-hinge helix DNA binding protein
MELSRTVSSKGQVTIPIEVRRRLRLKRGSRVDLVIKGRDIVLRPSATIPNPFAKYAGILAGKLPHTIEEIVREERLLRGHDPETELRPVGRRKAR